MFRLPPSPVSLLLAFATLAPALAGQPLPGPSPFVSAAAPAAKTSASAYEFVGMSVLGENTLLGILRSSDGHSVWVPLGRTIGEITAVGYDAKTDEAVIRVDGRALTLPLRNATVSPAPPQKFAVPLAPPPTTALVPPAPAAPLTAQQEKAMEAGMLVSDLLEIGQRQRLAYAEAEREARARAAAAPPAAAPAPPAAKP